MIISREAGKTQPSSLSAKVTLSLYCAALLPREPDVAESEEGACYRAGVMTPGPLPSAFCSLSTHSPGAHLLRELWMSNKARAGFPVRACDLLSPEPRTYCGPAPWGQVVSRESAAEQVIEASPPKAQSYLELNIREPPGASLEGTCRSPSTSARLLVPSQLKAGKKCCD